MDWTSIAKLSQEAFREGVNEWIGSARIKGGQVSGPSATLTPGSLVSDASIENRVFQKLLGSKVPSEISRVLAKGLAAAWNDWAAGFQMQIPKAYPSFAAFPGPLAPPTPAAGAFPLSQGTSSGEGSLKASSLAGKLASAVRIQTKTVEGSPDQALMMLAGWVEGSFDEWKRNVKMVGIMGQGDVPTYAPPYVPVGPVVRGVNVSAGPVFAGPRFGRVVF